MPQRGRYADYIIIIIIVTKYLQGNIFFKVKTMDIIQFKINTSNIIK